VRAKLLKFLVTTQSPAYAIRLPLALIGPMWGLSLATRSDARRSQDVRSGEGISDDACPCGSGRKYKRCCYAKAASLVQSPDGELAHELPMSHEMGAIPQRQREKFIACYGREARRG